MKSHVKYLGVVDKSNKIHYVEFNTGVNVITGKSSTGKSAMIELFDYCFGSSEFTIPSGIITDSADVYFMVLAIKDSFITIGRSPNLSKKFLKFESESPNIENLKKEYFEESYFTQDFNVDLGHYLGLDITDTDEDLEDRNYRKNNAKKGRPSIRNMIPFLLQHQNLVANKHSLFYRFDEKEKREQTIDQFKIFASFVKQEYYTIKQSLADEQRNFKSLENQQKALIQQNEFNTHKLNDLLDEYYAITGNKLTDESIMQILINPANTLQKLEKKEILTNYESEQSLKDLQVLRNKKNELYSKKRILQNKLNDISSSIEYANKHFHDVENLTNESEEKVKVSECPFCHTHNEKILIQANHLESAIHWLNGELSKSNYLLDSFESDKKEIEEQISSLDNEIRSIYQKINKLEDITSGLERNKSLEEQGLKVKLKIENLLENLVGRDSSSLEEQINISKKKIQDYQKDLKEKFAVTKKLLNAEKYINTEMKKIGEKFDFEETYKPINLKFSLESFDLWHERESGEKIYLRSMGSGANWLYSHVTLFLALHKFFCSLGDKSLIPAILFLDQPSQVYFPTSIKDENIEFNIDDIEAKKGTGTKDEDLRAVTNLFNQLVSFCKTTFEETGIELQVIVTDHADHLTLDNNTDFESLVSNRRWRTRGFINE
ncbi:DUF3732 domain-containing protein [Sulfurimonas sp.]|uniref:DUF3732 domain-containing protein n=1 Tax=Sulfurimonas sp. TaxID=2022749 RepID=UPI002601C83C|nr:DUF3732 domain-containing protein [Sulfurimonas sp.]MDD5158094.1 DUF3732 domain-containing protein [Sulfurimonas sp.]